VAISIRSVPGVGTTIEGSVPLPRDGRRWPPWKASHPPRSAHEAQDLYDGSAESCRLRAVRTQLDEPLQAGMTRMGDIRRVERLKAYSALRVRVLPTGQVIAP
jgi:hypothetical protein